MWWSALTLSSFVLFFHVAYGYHSGDEGNTEDSSTEVDFNECVVDLGFVLDGSGSVGQDHWQKTIDYVTSFATTLNISQEKAQIGVVTFGNEASLQIQLNATHNVPELTTQLSNLHYLDQNTNTAAGIRVAREQLFTEARGDRSFAANIMIIITDGLPTWEVNNTYPEAMKANDADIKIFTIGVGDYDMQTLYMIAFNHSERSFSVGSYENLHTVMNKVLSSTCKAAAAQEIVPAENDCDYDIAFVLDASWSVGTSNWVIVKEFLISYAEKHLHGDTRIGVVTFGSDASVEVSFRPETDLVTFRNDIENINYWNGATNMAAGLRVARESLFTTEHGARDDFPDRLVLITDGFTNSEYENALYEAGLCRDAGITIFTLDVGAQANDYQMLALAGNEDGRTGEVLSFQELTSAFVGTSAQFELTHCDCPRIDLTLVLDSSGSMGEDKWNLMKMFGTSLVDSFPMDHDATRLALVTYSSEAGAEFTFDRYSSSSEYRSAINALPMHGQRTNIAVALRITRQNVLQSSGDRSNVTNLVVLISDGKANVDVVSIPEEVKRLRELGTPVMVIGVGYDADMVMLRDIASLPETTYFRFYDHLSMLVDDAEDLAHDICTTMNDFTGSFESPRVDITEHPSNILFYLGTGDGSSEDWDLIKEYVASQLETNLIQLASNSGYRFGFYTQDDEIAFGTSLDGLPYRVRSLANPGASSFTETHLDDILDVIDSADSNNNFAIVIITNALPESEANSISAATLLARNDNIPVFLLAGGYRDANLMNTWFMDDIASEPASAFQVNLDTMADIEDIDLFSMIAFQNVPTLDSCDFEDEFFPLCFGEQAEDDDFDWTLKVGDTPSSHTGPDRAFSGAHYLYTEASNPRQAGDVAEYILPFEVEGSGLVDICLTFMYHMRGHHIGALQVMLNHEGRDHIRWQLSGPQTDKSGAEGWKLAAVPMVMTSGDKISIRGVRGDEFSGDIAIDYLNFKTSPCAFSLPNSYDV